MYLDATACAERKSYAENLAKEGFQFQKIILVGDILSHLDEFPEGPGQLSMKSWVSELVEVYATLFGLEQVGVRIAGLHRPMCPKFHVDHVPTRLVSSLSGEGCDWFADPAYFQSSDNSERKLAEWIERAEVSHSAQICQAPADSVVLMKGTRWSEEGLPVIHRSPSHQQPRLVLTLDFA